MMTRFVPSVVFQSSCAFSSSPISSVTLISWNHRLNHSHGILAIFTKRS